MVSKNILVLAGLTLIASPAVAAQQPATKGQPQAQEKTYCLQLEASTGTRLKSTECKTKKEWADDGVDVDALPGK